MNHPLHQLTTGACRLADQPGQSPERRLLRHGPSAVGDQRGDQPDAPLGKAGRQADRLGSDRVVWVPEGPLHDRLGQDEGSPGQSLRRQLPEISLGIPEQGPYGHLGVARPKRPAHPRERVPAILGGSGQRRRDPRKAPADVGRMTVDICHDYIRFDAVAIRLF